MAEREPIDATGRRTGEMPTDADPRRATPHATHDVVLLAAVADRDPDPTTDVQVRRMIADCAECATIADELRALAAGLADLPPTLAAPRDMRLSDADAARLRRGGFLRGLVRPFGLAGMPALQPLAGALTALGIAGLLLANIPLGLGSGAGAALAPAANQAASDASRPEASDLKAVYPAAASGSPEGASGAGDQASSAPGAAASSPAASTAPAASPSGLAYGFGPTDVSAAPTTHGDAPTLTSQTSTGPSIPPLTLISLVLILVGVALLALRAVARRID